MFLQTFFSTKLTICLPYHQIAEDILQFLSRDTATGVFVEHPEGLLVANLLVHVLGLPEHHLAELLECNDPAAVLQSVENVMNLRLRGVETWPVISVTKHQPQPCLLFSWRR